MSSKTCEGCGSRLIKRSQTIFDCKTCGAAFSGGTLQYLKCKNAGHKITSYVSVTWHCQNSACPEYNPAPPDDVWP